MDLIRSFLEDLRIVYEENNTDTDKSSATRSDIEDHGDVFKSAKNDNKEKDTESHVSVGRSFLGTSSLRSFKSVQATRSFMNHRTNIEDNKDYDIDDDKDGNETDAVAAALSCDPSRSRHSKPRSFSKFRLFRSRSNVELSTTPPSNIILYPSSTNPQDEDNIIKYKLDGVDDNPNNLFGYVCGVDFCASIDAVHSTGGTSTIMDGSDSILESPVSEPTPKKIDDQAGIYSLPQRNYESQKHIRRWGHGKLWTIIALVFAWAGCVCAIFTRQSIQFVTLKYPLEVTQLHEPIKNLGMIRVQLCYNESIPENSGGCEVVRLSRLEVDDMLFNLSRSLLTLGSFLGIALTAVLSTSIFWESINLLPVAAGYLLAYFLQSFSMLFFDTKLCHEYKCHMAIGGYLSIVTSICWIATLISIVKMDIVKLKSIRERRRAARKAVREARKKEKQKQDEQKKQRFMSKNFNNRNNECVDALDIEATINKNDGSVTNEKSLHKLVSL